MIINSLNNADRSNIQRHAILNFLVKLVNLLNLHLPPISLDSNNLMLCSLGPPGILSPDTN